jgi:predicted DsbA family dithiol-disulfide isomerase
MRVEIWSDVVCPWCYVGKPHLARKYGMSVGQAQQMIETMTATGAASGAVLDFAKARPGNTFDAHRLLHLAAERGLQGALKERLLQATFAEGEPIGDRGALLRLAVDVGLGEAEVTALLESDAYATEVREEESLAFDLGISAVPFFVIDRKFGVPGAQSPDVLLQALRRAWQKSASPMVPAVDTAQAPGCEGDSCAV